jgi:hypothetical protein
LFSDVARLLQPSDDTSHMGRSGAHRVNNRRVNDLEEDKSPLHTLKLALDMLQAIF